VNIFLLASDVPYRSHKEESVTAVNIFLCELLNTLRALGHSVVLQMIFNVHRISTTLSASEVEEIQVLESQGVRVLAPIYKEAYLSPGGWRHRLATLGKILFGGTPVKAFYPAVTVGPQVAEQIRATHPDVILSVISPEGVGATYGVHDCPKVSWQGSIDFFPVEARIRERRLFAAPRSSRGLRAASRWLLRELHQYLWLIGYRRAHVRLMKDMDVIACNGATMVEFYRRHGHRGTFYLGTGWIDCQTTPAAAPAPARRTLNIMGYVGYLAHTSSTFGLKFLLQDLMPVLRETLKDFDYRVHVIGSGEVVPSLKPLLQQPGIVVRGWVKDLDEELRSSDAFLVLDNAEWYRVPCARHIVAWSMGLCLLVHENSRQVFPEIQHLNNALVGANAQEIANCVRLAVTDAAVSQRVRAGGRRTYETRFRAAELVKRLVAEMNEVVQHTNGAGQINGRPG